MHLFQDLFFDFRAQNTNIITKNIQKLCTKHHRFSALPIAFFVLFCIVCRIIAFNAAEHLPWKAIGLRKKVSKYSAHQCIGSMNSIDSFKTRVCRFDNICYGNGKFLYFRKGKIPILFDKRHGIQYDFGNESVPFVSLYQQNHLGATFSPTVRNEEIPNSGTRHHGTYFLWRHWSENFGHFVWEELGSIYYTQRRFKDVEKRLQILHAVRAPTNGDTVRLINGILPAITSKPLGNLLDFVNKTQLTCFDRLYVGGKVPLFLLPNESLVEGREEYIMDFRTSILRHHGINAKLPKKPMIIITNKTQSIWAKGRMHRAIANVEEVYSFLRNSFPNAKVAVIEWHKIALKEQLNILAATSILITPCGGVSMNIPFLPEGAHAIIMDYLSEGKNLGTFGYQKGESASMDISFWNRFPHIKFMYYQVYSGNDVVWDFPGASSYREDASININIERIYDLVEVALETMNYI